MSQDAIDAYGRLRAEGKLDEYGVYLAPSGYFVGPYGRGRRFLTGRDIIQMHEKLHGTI